MDSISEHLDAIDRRIFQQKLAEIEATKFIGEDGKEYFRLPKPVRYPIAGKAD